MKRLLFFLSTFCFVGGTFAVSDSPYDYNPVNVKKYQISFVSEMEMVEGFHKVYGQERRKANITNDRFNQYYAIVGEGILSRCKDVKNKECYRAIAYISLSDELCLYALEAKNTFSSDTGAVLSYLRSKYAVGKGTGDSVIVCNWYSGAFYTLYRPTPYMSFLVSPQFRRYEVREGKTLLRNPITIGASGKYEDESRDLTIPVNGYPHWLDRIIYECMYFTHDVNRDWCEGNVLKKLSSSNGQRREVFSLLLYIRDDGHLRVRSLLPDSLLDHQKLLLDELQKIVEKQSAWNFNYLYTIDGRVFPGRYLYAIYNYDSGHWVFQDYIKTSPKKPKFLHLLAPYASPMGW